MGRIVSVLLASVVLTHSLDAAAPRAQWHKDLKAARTAAVQRKKPLFLLMTMPGCSYCEKLKRETLAEPQFARKLADNFVAVEINGLKETALTSKLKLRVYPTTVVVTPAGKVIEMIHGYRGRAAMIAQIDAVTARLWPKVASTKVNSAK